MRYGFALASLLLAACGASAASAVQVAPLAGAAAGLEAAVERHVEDALAAHDLAPAHFSFQADLTPGAATRATGDPARSGAIALRGDARLSGPCHDETLTSRVVRDAEFAAGPDRRAAERSAAAMVLEALVEDAVSSWAQRCGEAHGDS